MRMEIKKEIHVSYNDFGSFEERMKFYEKIHLLDKSGQLKITSKTIEFLHQFESKPDNEMFILSEDNAIELFGKKRIDELFENKLINVKK